MCFPLVLLWKEVRIQARVPATHTEDFVVSTYTSNIWSFRGDCMQWRVGSIHTSKQTKFCSENMKVRVEFEDIGITQRLALKNQSVRIGAGLILVQYKLYRILWLRSWTFGFHKLGNVLTRKVTILSLRVFRQIYSTKLKSLTKLVLLIKSYLFRSRYRTSSG